MNNSFRMLPANIAAICVLVSAGSMLHAQSTFGSLRGLALDASGAAIADTQVTLHSDDENTDRTVKTDGTGAFLFENVKAGHFSLLGAHQGFSSTNLKGITIDARQDLRVTLTLAVAESATTVEVIANPDQVNTENAAIADVKDNQLITELPLNNRATTTSPLGALPYRRTCSRIAPATSHSAVAARLKSTSQSTESPPSTCARTAR